MFRLRVWLVLSIFLSIPASAALHVDVDLSERRLTVADDDDVITTYDVAVGTKKKPTPRGTFSVEKIVWNPAWHPPDEKWARGKSAKEPGDPDNPMKTVKIFFSEPDYYIHGTDATDSIGYAASHGCIRMEPSEAAELAKTLMEHGGEPRPEPWYRRILHRRSTKVILLQKPIAMSVRE